MIDNDVQQDTALKQKMGIVFASFAFFCAEAEDAEAHYLCARATARSAGSIAQVGVVAFCVLKVYHIVRFHLSRVRCITAMRLESVFFLKLLRCDLLFFSSIDLGKKISLSGLSPTNLPCCLFFQAYDDIARISFATATCIVPFHPMIVACIISS